MSILTNNHRNNQTYFNKDYSFFQVKKGIESRSMYNEKLFITIGGFIIKFEFIKNEEVKDFIEYFILLIKHYYKNFIIKENSFIADYSIEVIYHKKFQVLQSKKDKGIFINFYQQVGSKKIKTYYHVSAMQLEIIIRSILYNLLLKNDGFILHSSAVNIDNKAYVFLGNSGAGKSTIASFLASVGVPLGDDTTIIRREKDSYYCYSSAAVEKNFWNLKNPRKVSLAKVFFIKKSKSHGVTVIKNKEEIVRLLNKQVYIEGENLHFHFRQMLKMINSFSKFYFLEFSLTESPNLLRSIIQKI
jgi:hypothetical protein